MTTEQVLVGVGLTVVLAVGSQVLAACLRLPALIVLLPVGFAAGALIDDVDPQQILGAAFSPLVSLAVAVILYDAGLGLDLSRLTGHVRRVVVRLIWIGVLITGIAGALVAVPLLGMAWRSALMLGTILVVSGPTVVGPLLGFVRPADRLQEILVWEGSLIDPVGGILGAVVFHFVVAGTHRHLGSGVAMFSGSLGVGLLGGAVGTAVLWLLLRRLDLGEVLGTTVQLAVVIGVAAGCDAFRDDTGLISAVVMGLAVANSRLFADVSVRRPFFETLVSLILGLLFISISAGVTPHSLRHVVLPALALAAVLVLAVRPLVAWIAALGTDLTRGERAFVGWMAPRGIVAAATASTFSASLAAKGIGGAAKILPATFVVIVATVTVYGLSAGAVARRLGVVRSARSRPLLVGGEPWVVALAQTLASAGLEVLVWAGAEEQREALRRAGLALAPGELLAAATGEGAELAGITDVFLLTAEDDFNALATAILQGNPEVAVHRIGAARDSVGVVAPFLGGDALFGPDLSGVALTRRHAAGAALVARPVPAPPASLPPGWDVLFVVRPDGTLLPAVPSSRPTPVPGDTAILLGP